MSSAYVKTISPNSVEGEHQTSPAWIVTFLRWGNRFTKEYNSPNYQDVRPPMVIRNDCVSVSVTSAKDSYTPAAQCTFLGGDINYIAAVAPGDFFFVNMLNDHKESERVASAAANGKAVNGVNDGFKGFFKVQSVRQILGIDPNTGLKRIMYTISGFAFTEFNNTIYFNPYMLSEKERESVPLFLTALSEKWIQYIGHSKGGQSVQTIIKLLVDYCIGSSTSSANNKKGVQVSPNTFFWVPKLTGDMLGIKGVKSAKDLYRYLFGIQRYSAGSKTTPLSTGMNPSGTVTCQGTVAVKPEYWNQVTLWSIMNQYLNSPINEMFTCFKVDKNNRVLPTVVMRQIPFSSDKYKGVGTKFLSLPRWKISADLIYDINIGREEAARINFVQVFGRMSYGDKPDANIPAQIARGNFVSDKDDVKRSGLRPYIITSNFDDPVNSDKATFHSAAWASLLSDALMGGHLKMNGSITCAGIVDPICVGDNLEFDDTVYHIESITHAANINANGLKTFRTILNLSHGVHLQSSAKAQLYPQMKNTDVQAENLRDWREGEAVRPGIGDSQDIKRRDKTSFEEQEKKSNTINNPFGPAPMTRSQISNNKKKGKK